MEQIDIRYGQSLDMAVSTDDLYATSATFLVGNVGQGNVITKTVPLSEGLGQITLTPEDTAIAVGTYVYQLNVLHADGQLEKYPEPEDCDEDGLPKFVVHESLDA